MAPEAQNSPDDGKPEAGNPQPSEPPKLPPPIAASAAYASPPPLPEKPRRKSLKHLLTILLSLCLATFLADGLISLLDDTAILLFDNHGLTILRVVVFLPAALLALVVYVLMGLTPRIPKGIFLPVTLFNLIAQLVVIPVYIYAYRHAQVAIWSVSLVEVLLAGGVLCWVQGGFRIRWPLLPENRLQPRAFSWPNLLLFLGINGFLVLPAAAIYLWVCAAKAVDHFSDSFMALRPAGFTVQVRTYARADGKRIQLVPMSHIGESEFYRELSRSFPTNALILMEGVTDNQGLLTNKISYRRVASSLGLAEQQKEFKPKRQSIVRADIDVDQFAPSTIGVLNVAMLIHTRGLTPENLAPLMQFSPPPHFEEQLMEDLLRKRNRHLLQEIQSHLDESAELIVPWGVAHMPEIAQAIEKSGFQLVDSHEFVAIRFHAPARGSNHASQGNGLGIAK